MREIMEGAFKLDVPLGVEVAVGEELGGDEAS